MIFTSDFTQMLETGHRPSADPVYMPAHSFAGLFPIGRLSMIGGKAGIGKSWFVRHCMMQASIGQDVFGNPVDDGPMKSACFCGEDDLNDIMKRDYELRNGNYDRTCNIYYTLEGLAMVGVNPVLGSPQDPESVDKFFDMLKQMIAWYRETKPGEPPLKAIFFDSLSSFNEGDENSNKDMRALCFRLMNFAHSEDIALVLVHHKRKRSKDCKDEDDTDEFSGSAAMMRFVKTAYSLKKPPKNDSNVNSSNFCGVGNAAVAVEGHTLTLIATQVKSSSLMVPAFTFNVNTYDGNDKIAVKDSEENYTIMEAVPGTNDDNNNKGQGKSNLQEQLTQGIMDFMIDKKEALSSEIKNHLKEELEITFSDGTFRQVTRDLMNRNQIARDEKKRGNDYVYRVSPWLYEYDDGMPNDSNGNSSNKGGTGNAAVENAAVENDDVGDIDFVAPC